MDGMDGIGSDGPYPIAVLWRNGHRPREGTEGGKNENAAAVPETGQPKFLSCPAVEHNGRVQMSADGDVWSMVGILRTMYEGHGAKLQEWCYGNSGALGKCHGVMVMVAADERYGIVPRCTYGRKPFPFVVMACMDEIANDDELGAAGAARAAYQGVQPL
jgi:hypothetical protein